MTVLSVAVLAVVAFANSANAANQANPADDAVLTATENPAATTATTQANPLNRTENAIPAPNDNAVTAAPNAENAAVLNDAAPTNYGAAKNFGHRLT